MISLTTSTLPFACPAPSCAPPAPLPTSPPCNAASPQSFTDLIIDSVPFSQMQRAEDFAYNKGGRRPVRYNSRSDVNAQQKGSDTAGSRGNGAGRGGSGGGGGRYSDGVREGRGGGDEPSVSRHDFKDFVGDATDAQSPRLDRAGRKGGGAAAARPRSGSQRSGGSLGVSSSGGRSRKASTGGRKSASGSASSSGSRSQVRGETSELSLYGHTAYSIYARHLVCLFF